MLILSISESSDLLSKTWTIREMDESVRTLTFTVSSESSQTPSLVAQFTDLIENW